LQREQLRQQHGNGVQADPYNSHFRSAAIKNILPDPDIPGGCDPNSAEYV